MEVMEMGAELILQQLTCTMHLCLKRAAGPESFHKPNEGQRLPGGWQQPAKGNGAYHTAMAFRGWQAEAGTFELETKASRGLHLCSREHFFYSCLDISHKLSSPPGISLGKGPGDRRRAKGALPCKRNRKDWLRVKGELQWAA